MEQKMFCYQCQETAKGTGCILQGVCGKDYLTAGAQDLLVNALKAVSVVATAMRRAGADYDYKQTNELVAESLFSTITNANFDVESIRHRVAKALAQRDRLVAFASEQGIELPQTALLDWAPREEEYEEEARRVGILAEGDEDRRSLAELTIYGLKGMAAYREHAGRLGYESDEIDAFIQRALCEIALGELSVPQMIDLVMSTGHYGVEVMALLDKANTETYGHPEVTEVNIGVGNRPGILISGHDLKDMEELLKQTEGTGVDVYTHSEMLPANYYPKFKQYKHFFGNYGNAWWKQTEEFETFNGPILFTTNCIVPPRKTSTYRDRVYTTNATGYPGFKYIPVDENGCKDFSEIIEVAKTCQPPKEIERGSIVGGFAHHQVLALADKVVEAVKSGAIRKFVVMGGCDGRMKGRDYYTDFAKQLPQDTVILTAGCAKYRYNKLALGDIAGIPRVLDAGQCNDSYSLAVIALKLKEAFGLDDINDLPIVYNIAWYEQKAVIVLLALLSLGVKKIHLGPTLPAFLSPGVAKVLIETFGIGAISDVETDLEQWIA